MPAWLHRPESESESAW